MLIHKQLTNYPQDKVIDWLIFCMLFLARVENVTNEQTHIGGWVKNVTNGRTDEHTVTTNWDGRTDGRTESSFLR